MSQGRFISLLAVAIVIACIFAAPLQANSTDTFGTMPWFKRGCYAAVYLSHVKAEDYREEQGEYFSEVLAFYTGFLSGIGSPIDSNDFATDVRKIPKEFCDFKAVAPSILAFIEKNKDRINEETQVRTILVAWYLQEHPASTETEKKISAFYLDTKGLTEKPRANAKGEKLDPRWEQFPIVEPKQ